MILFTTDSCIPIFLENDNPYVKLAAEDMRRDFARVSSSSVMPEYIDAKSNWCIVIEANKNAVCDPVSDESFSINTVENVIHITASSYLGTMWGIYTFCEKVLGVDPCFLFNDNKPKKRDSLITPPIFLEGTQPSFKFRGIFINDEDLLSAWKDGGGLRKFDYSFYSLTVAPEVMDRVVETALRLKLNLIIPATLIDLDNPCEKVLADCVAKRGIYISQHHIEPLGLSHFTLENYCKKFGTSGEYSFFNCPELLKEAWTYYVRKWAEYDNVVWQIGLRGKADRPVWEEATPTKDDLLVFGKKISEAMQLQKQIVLDITGGKAKYFSTTLWMEGSVLAGADALDAGNDVITIFADSGPDQLFCDDFFDIDRKKNQPYGIYYHLQYYHVGPHLAPQTGLDKLYHNIRLASQKGDTAYSIVNASNIREFTFELDAYAKMLWNLDGFSKSAYLDLYCERFGDAKGKMKGLISLYFDTLPEAKNECVYQELAKYFHYSRGRYPENIKAFVIKEGFILTRGRVLINKFKMDKVSGLHENLCDEYYRVLLTAIPKFKELCVGLETVAKEQDDRYIKTRWLCHAYTLLCIYEWFVHLYQAKQCYDANDSAQTKAELTSACNSLQSLLEYRKCAEYGEFENWYRGDVKMNIKKSLADTKGIIGYC